MKKRKLLFLALIIFSTIKSFAQPGALDFSFITGDGASAEVYTTNIQSDGKIIIGGAFITFNGVSINRIARLNADGTLDVGFNSGSGSNNIVYSSAIQPDGKIIIGGDFTSYNGTTKNFIARLNNDGTIDNSFNIGAGANDRVNTITIQPDGKIIIGGFFTTYNGISRSYLARLNNDGTLDNTFNIGLGANNWLYLTVLQPDGKIIIGGDFTAFNLTNANRVIRLNTDGTVDNTFNIGSGANNGIRSITLQPDGKIIIGGNFTSFNGLSAGYITRLNADGALDNTFNSGIGANNSIYTTLLLPNGKIIIGGIFTFYNGIPISRLARLNIDGTLDSVFNPGTGSDSWIITSKLQPDGKILIGGAFTSYDGTLCNRIGRIINSCISSAGIDVISACSAFTWIDGNTYSESNNTATFTITGGATSGCDSLLTLNLTIQNLDNAVTVFENTLTANATSANYQWLDCENGYSIISGATNQNYTTSINGTYAVTLTQNNCIDTSLCYNITLTGQLDEQQDAIFLVYPNPFSSETTVLLPRSLNNATLIIENSIGQKVMCINNIPEQAFKLQRCNLSPGVYLLHVVQDEKLVASKKIVIID